VSSGLGLFMSGLLTGLLITTFAAVLGMVVASRLAERREDAEFETLNSNEERMRNLAALVIDDEPTGEIVRVWTEPKTSNSTTTTVTKKATTTARKSPARKTTTARKAPAKKTTTAKR
jgi:hypothetical protein